jgi:hypothetical protein
VSSNACRVLSNHDFSISAHDDETSSGVHDGGGSKGGVSKKEEFESSGRVELAALDKARGTAEAPFVIDDDDDDDDDDRVAVDLSTDSKAGAR